MPTKTAYPTPYPDVNTILKSLLLSVQAVLQDRFIGMYLYGSLASGGFDPNSSDIDFLVVTTAEIRDEVLAALVAMHARIAASDSKWAIQLEGSYISKDALRRYDPAHRLHPHIDRGGGELRIEQHDSDWVIQRYILREYGVVIEGPALDTLIDPISPDELQRAVLSLLNMWWEPMLRNPVPLQHAGYRSYAVMTMCRVLYTLQHSQIVPKGAAARWAEQSLDERWRPLIELAATERNGTSLISIDDTLAFICYTVERSQQFRKGEMIN